MIQEIRQKTEKFKRAMFWKKLDLLCAFLNDLAVNTKPNDNGEVYLYDDNVVAKILTMKQQVEIYSLSEIVQARKLLTLYYYKAENRIETRVKIRGFSVILENGNAGPFVTRDDAELVEKFMPVLFPTLDRIYSLSEDLIGLSLHLFQDLDPQQI